MDAMSRSPQRQAPRSAPEGAGVRSDLIDRDLLHRIGQDLRSVYGDILDAPLPDRVVRLLARLDDAVARESNGV